MKSSTDPTVQGSIPAGSGTATGASSGGTSFSSLRNRVHLAVTPQAGSSRAAARATVPAQRPPVGRETQEPRPAEAVVTVNPSATDPSLRRTVQTVPNQLR